MKTLHRLDWSRRHMDYVVESFPWTGPSINVTGSPSSSRRLTRELRDILESRCVDAGMDSQGRRVWVER